MPRTLRGDLVRLGLACVAGAGALCVYTTLRIVQQGDTDESGRPADAIVVLGAAHYGDEPSAVFAARLDHAVALYLRGAAPVLIVTGGRAEGDLQAEADVARAYAVQRGVPDRAILAEDTGRDTVESMRNVAALMAATHLSTALFVSDRSHMLRVLRIATDLGITAYGSPTGTSPSDRDLGARIPAVVHEIGALALYLGLGR